MQAAVGAGKIALRHWRSAPEFWEKPGQAGPVSVADMEVNADLEAVLQRARPDYGWLSEETLDTPARLGTERTFIIDPIDGTRAFLAGEPSFSHALAIVEGGEVTAAVVYLPALDLMFAATPDATATLNGAPITASDAQVAPGSSVLTAKANLAPEHWLTPPDGMVREFRNSMAYRLCLVAQGRFDASLSLRPTWEWDIAAGDLIARQAGAAVTDRHGARIRYNLPHPQAAGIIAAPKVLHSALISALKPV